MKRIFLILFLVIITASLAFSDGFLGSGNPTLPVIDALYGTTPGANVCALFNNGTCGTPAGSLACGANIPVLGTGQCGTNTIGSYVLQSSLRTDTTGANTSFIPHVNSVGNIDMTVIGTGLTLDSNGTLHVTASTYLGINDTAANASLLQGHAANYFQTALGANAYDPYGAAAAVTPTSLGLVIGTNTQAHNAKLDAIASLANSAGQLTNDGSGNFSYTSGSVANAWVQGGLAPVSGKPLLAGTGANASMANITIQGTAGSTYNLDNMGGGNVTVAMAIGGNVTNGTPGYLLYVGTNSVLAQSQMGANVLAALGIAANTTGGFQGTLISGTNIKTVSGHALLGSGDVALTVSDVANSLSFSGSPTTGHLAQIGAANTIVDGGTGSNLSVNYAVNAGTAAAANSVAGANVSGNVAGANSVAVGGITGLGTGVATALGIATNTINGFVQLIASGTANIPTGTIGANASVLLTAANASVVAGEIVDWAFGGNYVGNAGFIPGAQLSIMSYTGSGNVDFIISNNTGANITPAANMTIVWSVRR
jgi:hypothetical protein